MNLNLKSGSYLISICQNNRFTGISFITCKQSKKKVHGKEMLACQMSSLWLIRCHILVTIQIYNWNWRTSLESTRGGWPPAAQVFQMEMRHPNILQTPPSSKLLPSFSQPRKPRHRRARLAEAQRPHHGPPRSQTPRINLTSVLRTTPHHSRSSLPDFQTREAPLASLSGTWEKRQSWVVS